MSGKYINSKPASYNCEAGSQSPFGGLGLGAKNLVSTDQVLRRNGDHLALLVEGSILRLEIDGVAVALARRDLENLDDRLVETRLAAQIVLHLLDELLGQVLARVVCAVNVLQQRGELLPGDVTVLRDHDALLATQWHRD